MDREPGRGRGLAEEAGQLDAADAHRPDLRDRDPPAIELPGEEVGGVAQAATRDQLTTRVGARARRQLDVWWAVAARGREWENGREGGATQGDSG